MTRTGERIPRPLPTALHGSRPNEVVHCDYLYIGASNESEMYVLLLRDDFSSFVWIWPTTPADSESAADALAMWVATFECMDCIVSD